MFNVMPKRNIRGMPNFMLKGISNGLPHGIVKGMSKEVKKKCDGKPKELAKVMPNGK